MQIQSTPELQNGSHSGRVRNKQKEKVNYNTTRPKLNYLWLQHLIPLLLIRGLFYLQHPLSLLLLGCRDMALFIFCVSLNRPHIVTRAPDIALKKIFLFLPSLTPPFVSSQKLQQGRN